MLRGEHRQIVLVEIVDSLGVVHDELVVRDLVDPGVNDLAEQLTTGLTTDRFGDYSDGLLGFDEAERHRSRKVRATPDGKTGICPNCEMRSQLQAPPLPAARSGRRASALRGPCRRHPARRRRTRSARGLP